MDKQLTGTIQKTAASEQEADEAKRPEASAETNELDQALARAFDLHRREAARRSKAR